MKWLAPFYVLILCGAAACGSTATPAAPTTPEKSDGAVLEAVLVDLLTYKKSPLEPKRAVPKRIYFSTEALDRPPQVEDILRPRDPKAWAGLKADRQGARREAAEELSRRAAAKERFSQLVPKDPRIELYSKERDEEDQKTKIGFERPQVFRAYPPGYSRDGQTAIVLLSFGWSLNFHGASGTYVLARKRKGWEVVVREFTLYV